MTSKKIVLSLLLLVGTIFAFVQCNKQTETAQPASTQKARTNKSGSANKLIAHDVNGKVVFTVTQQQMKTAIENAFTTAQGITVTADSTIYMVDEVNPQTNQTEYTLLLPITMPDNTREYVGMAVERNGGDYTLMDGRQRSCDRATGVCTCKFNFWGACICTNGGPGSCAKVIIRTYLAEEFAEDISY